jgi:TIR domain
MPTTSIPQERTVVFISKATPGDDEFVLWLAPRLEAAGYEVFADILTLEPGTRGRKEITDTLQQRATKMLLCGRNATLEREGVQEEIGIAEELAKELEDKKFIIPLRLEKYRKLFGIGELQYVNFERGWAEGLVKLLVALKRQRVPCRDTPAINPNWEQYRRRSAIPLINEPERLTSNWLRVAECPDVIRYFVPSGAVDTSAMNVACRALRFPASPRDRGFFAFAATDEINELLAGTGKFRETHAFDLLKFISEGAPELKLVGKDASNIVNGMYRKAWNALCVERGLLEYQYSASSGYHVGAMTAKLGQRIPWGGQGDRRWSMLRNEAKGHVWQFGVTGIPAFWPLQHFKLKSRVIFAPPSATDDGKPYEDKKKQHRLRRSVCKSWRNKQWHGRLMALLELLAGEFSFISLPLSPAINLLLDPTPMLFTSPVSTALPNILGDEDEEDDESTLGRPELPPEEESE